MFGANVGELRVVTRSSSNGKDTQVWRKTSSQGDKWNRLSFTISQTTKTVSIDDMVDRLQCQFSEDNEQIAAESPNCCNALCLCTLPVAVHEHSIPLNKYIEPILLTTDSLTKMTHSTFYVTHLNYFILIFLSAIVLAIIVGCSCRYQSSVWLDQVLEVISRLMMSLLTASPVMVTQVRFIIENLFLCHNVDKHFSG
mgnify:CR=1 FL=1